MILKKFFATWIAVLAICFAAIVGVSAPASAATTDPYPYPHNGCTYAPDTILGSDITPACNHHDGCYALHSMSRLDCDRQLRQELYAVCAQMTPLRSGACYSIASLYYGSVRLFGAHFYNAPYPADRISTRMAT